jgi:cytochrome c556
MRFSRILATGVVSAVLAGTMVFAANDTPQGAAAVARQSQMRLYAFNLGQLGAMAKGAVEYNAGAAQAAADNLVALATSNQMSYWIPGSSTADMEGTAALPAIWQPGSEVGAKGKALAEAALAMQAAAGSLDGIRASIGTVGGACGSCHKAYRKPKN